MFCAKCGRQIPDNSNVCSFCGQPTSASMGMTQNHSSIDNIFSALVRERTPGVIMEFSMWCVACVVVIMSLIAAVLSEESPVAAWIMLMIFSIGLGVIMAFRLKTIAMLYSSVIFELVFLIIHYAVFSIKNSDCSGLNIAVFVFALLGAVGLVACSVIQFFTKFNLGSVCTIIAISLTALIMLLNILLFAVPCLGEYADYNEEIQWAFNKYGAYWLGTVSYWLMIIVTALYYAFFFWGFIDSRKDKIIRLNVTPVRSNFVPGLRGVQGLHQGQIFYLQGNSITIGSEYGMGIIIQNNVTSRRHCTIRYNTSTGCYEVLDESTNGVYLSNGTRLTKGVFTAIPRGNIIFIGNASQQFQLI